MLACKCLNVGIQSETKTFPAVSHCSLNLTWDEVKDAFFRQELQKVEKLKNVSTVHSGLVQKRIVGPWTISRCINCSMDTHAINKQKEDTVLVSSLLLRQDSISILRNSDLFSRIFNIVIKQYELEDDKIDDMPGDSEQETVIRGLKQIVSEALKKEAVIVEDRIRQFTEQQTQELDALRDRALKEHRSLARAVLSSNSSDMWVSPLSTNQPISSPKPISKSAQASSSPLSRTHFQSPVTRSKSTSDSANMDTFMSGVSVDAQGLFPFDGLDDYDTYPRDDTEDPDDVLYNDDTVKDDGVDIPRSRSQLSVAKSLPMNIPVFMSSFHNHMHEDQDDTLPPAEDVQDIAASIKALAKSVHGDTVFGDLPRPRFSTQI